MLPAHINSVFTTTFSGFYSATLVTPTVIQFVTILQTNVLNKLKFFFDRAIT